MRDRPDGRLVLLGATGTTGRQVAHAMVRQGLRPILADNDEAQLQEFADELSTELPRQRTVEVAQVDSSAADGVREVLTSPGDVLVSALDKFSANGTVGVRAAIDAGCGYLDCAWEPSFIRKVFTTYSSLAEASGSVLLTGFGTYYVAGSLAATIAIRRTMVGSHPPARVDIGYLGAGPGRSSALNEALIDDTYRFSEGRIKTERPGARVRPFDIGGRHQEALSLGTAEHLTIPRLGASIAEINVYVGWFGRMTRAAAMAATVSGTASKMPGLGGVWGSVVRGFGAGGSIGVPDSGLSGRTVVVAETYDIDGAFQQRVRVEGPPPHELTASLLSWGSGMVCQGVESGVGALGPAEAFGTEALISGCMALGLAEIRHGF